MIVLQENQQKQVNTSIANFIKRMNTNVFIVFDIETNGLLKGIDDILSISAQKCRIASDKSLDILDTYNRYYYCSTRYNPGATRINGLVDDSVVSKKRGENDKKYSRYFNDDRLRFFHFIGGCPNFIGHNCIDFDMCWFDNDIFFSNIFDTYIENMWIPTDKDIPNRKLPSVAKFYGIESDAASFHASSYDVEMSKEIFANMLKLSNIRMIQMKEADIW